ncbi:cell division protein SepF, partial [Streptomyces sp. NPDC057557]|uniref:cell division protein SepF n=1 Tax=Streptomyces sp. NPDC057557 TaxID=3346167 RepID=UPI0036BFED91
MGSVRKASAWLGLVEDNDERYYDDDEYAEGAQTGTGQAWVTDPRVQVASEAAEETGRRIATVTPDSFRDARAIGELFRDGIPVIVNLTTMDPTDAKRVVDFAAGLTFGLRGSIERVATRVFLLTPADTQVVNGEAGRAAARGGVKPASCRRAAPRGPGTRGGRGGPG